MDYQRSELLRHRACEPPPPSTTLVARAEKAGWSAELLDRLLRLRRNRDELLGWLDDGFPTVDMIESWLADQEALLASTLTVRQAGWDDNDLISELCADSPETVGDWQVTVERGPYAFAQFRLQERCYLVLVEDMRVGLGMAGRSVRNTLVGGERMAVQFMSGWRVRNGFRGIGVSRRLLEAAGPGTNWLAGGTYWYTRLDNADRSWIDKVTGEIADRPQAQRAVTDDLTATVTHLTSLSGTARSERSRRATHRDLDRCCELINRTHAGLDLFRPYTPEFLGERLDDPCWGPRASFYPPVYGWDDFRVIERDGTVVACCGLWDRGRNVRERWTDADGVSRSVATTALLDVGHAEGAEDDLVELIRHQANVTAALGRAALVGAFEFLGSIAERLTDLDPLPETRGLHTMPMILPGRRIELVLTRPYTDLVYW